MTIERKITGCQVGPKLVNSANANRFVFFFPPRSLLLGLLGYEDSRRSVGLLLAGVAFVGCLGARGRSIGFALYLDAVLLSPLVDFPTLALDALVQSLDQSLHLVTLRLQRRHDVSDGALDQDSSDESEADSLGIDAVEGLNDDVVLVLLAFDFRALLDEEALILAQFVKVGDNLLSIGFRIALSRTDRAFLLLRHFSHIVSLYVFSYLY